MRNRYQIEGPYLSGLGLRYAVRRVIDDVGMGYAATSIRSLSNAIKFSKQLRGRDVGRAPERGLWPIVVLADGAYKEVP